MGINMSKKEGAVENWLSNADMLTSINININININMYLIFLKFSKFFGQISAKLKNVKGKVRPHGATARAKARRRPRVSRTCLVTCLTFAFVFQFFLG